VGLFDQLPDFLMTERLRLRPWVEADASSYRELWLERDPRSVRVIDPDGRPTVADLRDKIGSHLAAKASAGFGLMVVESRIEKNFIGYCGLIGRNETPDEPEVAYELLRSAQGRGYATEAVRAVRDAAATAGRTRLWAGVRSWNTASLHVLDKLGFVPSGHISLDPERGDTVFMTCRLHRAT